MKYLKLLALPILGIFMTGCISMQNNSMVKTNGDFESTIRVDMSEFMKLMAAQDPTKDAESDEKSDVCVDIKENYPNSYDCKEITEYVHEFKNKGMLSTSEESNNITVTLNKHILLVDDQKVANKSKAKNGKADVNPQKFTQIIKFSGEIISSKIGTIDGNQLTILDGIGKDETFLVTFSKNKFDEKSYQYKEKTTSKSHEVRNKFSKTLDESFYRDIRNDQRKKSASIVRSILLAEEVERNSEHTYKSKEELMNVLNYSKVEISQNFTEEKPLYFVKDNESVHLIFCLEDQEKQSSINILGKNTLTTLACEESENLITQNGATVFPLFTKSEQKKEKVKTMTSLKGTEKKTPKIIKKTLTETQKNNVKRVLKSRAKPVQKNYTFKKTVRKNSYQPELIIERITQRTTELQKNRTPEILQNFFQKAAFKK